MSTATTNDAVCSLYAKVLMETALAKGGQALVEEIGSELLELAEGQGRDAKVVEFFRSRIVPAASREAVLRKAMSGRCNDLVLNLMLTLNFNGRLGRFRDVAAAFDSLVQARFGRVEVDVFTASPLNDGDKATLTERISRALGRPAVLHVYVEAGMIGGVKLRIGDQLIDASYQTRLTRLRQQLAENGLPALRAKFDRLVDGVDPRNN